MTPEALVVDGTLEVTGDVEIEDEAPATVEDLPNPVVALNAAYFQASMLAEAGATYQIRYTAMKAGQAIERLIRDLEHHRRITGE